MPLSGRVGVRPGAARWGLRLLAGGPRDKRSNSYDLREGGSQRSCDEERRPRAATRMAPDSGDPLRRVLAAELRQLVALRRKPITMSRTPTQRCAETCSPRIHAETSTTST